MPVPGMVGKKVVQYHDNRMCMEGEGEGTGGSTQLLQRPEHTLTHSSHAALPTGSRPEQHNMLWDNKVSQRKEVCIAGHY